MSDNELHDRIVQTQQSWHGWGSPVGLGLGFALLASSVAAVIAAVFRRHPRGA